MNGWLTQVVQRLKFWKQSQDADNDDRIDRAESVDDGTYSKTAQQISEHIDSTSDPHNTIPSQAGNSGKYLTTNGSATSWGTVSGGSSTITITAGVALSQGDITYKKDDDSKHYLAIANTTDSQSHEGLGIVNTSSILIGNTGDAVIDKQIITGNATFSSTDIGKEVFLSADNAGKYDLFANLTFTTGEHVVKIGTIWSTTEILFDPEFRYTI